MGKDAELESFKTINLTEYAANQGYVLDKKRSGKTSAVMKSGNDKIVIAIDETDNHWVFFTVGNSSQNGSIIDFVQKCQGGNIGNVRQELRPWANGDSSVRSPIVEYLPSLKPVTKDKAQVIANVEEMTLSTGNQYLENDRAIPSSTLVNFRFLGKILEDKRHNVIFPHYDKSGLCGFEMRNKSYKGFSRGGTKGMWFSAANSADKRLVIAESGMKALSYNLLFPDSHTRYASIAGKMNNIQPDLIRSAVAKLPPDGEIILAMDNDKAGEELAEEIKTIIAEDSNISVKVDLPKKENFDWNDVLTEESKSKVTNRSR